MSNPAPLRREIIRFVIAGIVAAAALAIILADLGDTVATAVARPLAAATIVLIGLWFVERRLSQRLARLERAEYWRIYAAVLADLGGVDGETSGEIPTTPRH